MSNFMSAPVWKGNKRTRLPKHAWALVGVWCGISVGLSVEVATTMATSCRGEWDKTPVRDVLTPHHSPWSSGRSTCHSFWYPYPFFYTMFFWRGISLMGLFNGPCKYSSISTLLIPRGSLLECVCIFVCVCAHVVCLCQTTAPPQWWMVLSAMSHSAGSLWHEGALNVLTWVWRAAECRFHILPDNEIKEVRSEFQPFLLQKHPGKSIFLS